MELQMIQQVANELQLAPKAIETVLTLLNEGNTVPFIARYRKEQTGSLDEVQIREIAKHWQTVQQLEKRREQVIRLIAEQGLLDKNLAQKLAAATRMQELDDLYLPFQQKRQTKATAAIALGLAPLAQVILTGEQTWGEIEILAQAYCREEIPTVAEVLQQTAFILAQTYSETATIRQRVRSFLRLNGVLMSKRKPKAEDEKQTFQMYYDYRVKLSMIPNHQILALNRGEKLGILQVKLEVDQSILVQRVMATLMKRLDSSLEGYINHCFADAYKRLLFPSLEREIRQELSQRAQTQAIQVFSQNVQQLLLQPPLKGQTILGLDPAYRTGCKLAVIDAQGDVVAIEVIYPHKPQNQREQASKQIQKLVQAYQVGVIAIGNGTASRESEEFIAETMKSARLAVPYLIVSEAGASVYSASEEAIREFPHLQVEQRSAVSIARRVLDPLAELIKIDPQSLGVGQYQHDLPTGELQAELGAVVESAVNRVGVELNTASAKLLASVSGLNMNVAQQIVQYRQEQGVFTSRQQLKKVPRLGAKTFEQAAGFLRIQAASHPFDQTPIHPESYRLAEGILKKIGFKPTDLGTDALQRVITELDQLALSREINAGLETVQDILAAFLAPNRDPRDEYPQPLLRQDVLSFSDLQIGMHLQGTVRNIVDFGAFVDIGVKFDGLIHKSEFGKRINHPMEIVALNDIVSVEIIALDQQRQTIGLRYLTVT
ncbi:MAG: Tex family protein [Culicoidibacterales bacterium]